MASVHAPPGATVPLKNGSQLLSIETSSQLVRARSRARQSLTAGSISTTVPCSRPPNRLDSSESLSQLTSSLASKPASKQHLRATAHAKSKISRIFAVELPLPSMRKLASESPPPSSPHATSRASKPIIKRLIR
jgi:hypothetical protein